MLNEHFFFFDWCLHHRKSCCLSFFLCAGFWWAGYFCFEIGSWRPAAILFGWLRCFSGGPGVGVSFWFGLEVWWADRFWFEIRSQFFGSSLVLGLFGVLSVDQRLRNGGSWLIFREGVLRMWLDVDVEDWVLFYKGVLLRWVVATSVMDVFFFFQWSAVLGAMFILEVLSLWVWIRGVSLLVFVFGCSA